MQFSTAALATAILGFTAAAPLEARSNPVYPSHLSQWNADQQKATVDTGYGLITRAQGTSDISTLLTFDLPSEFWGKQCTLNLKAPHIEGSGQFAFFSSLFPAASDKNNGRNNQLSAFQAAGWGLTPLEGNAATFACPSGQFNAELTPLGVADTISFGAGDIWVSY